MFDKEKVDPIEYLTSNHNTDVTHAWQGFPAILALGIFALSGFCAMACEVIWTRLLGLVLGPTPYAFTLVLFTFILGLALGNLLFGKLADLGSSRSTGATEGGGAWHLFALTQALAAILILVSSQLLGNGPVFFSKLAISFRHGFWAGRACEAIALSIFMFPPAIAFGASFPLLVRMGFHPGGSAGRYVGRAFAINTLGGVLGALGAGLILVPWLGKEISISLVAGLQGLGGLALALTPFPLARVRPMLRGGLAILALASLSLAMVLPRWDRLGLSRSAYYDADPKLLGYGWLEALFKPHRLISGASSGEEVYYGDGIGGFTTVWKTTGPLGDEDFTLFNSGKADASAQADMFTQALCAHFPLAFHPHPRSVMVLGLASGITAGEALNYPVESLDILEINRQVVGASRFFIKWNKDVISQPKTRLILQDGKAHLLLTDKRYDVIISEPSNPWMAGLSELYSLDFFTTARSKLGPEGMFVQFIHSYQMDWATFSMVGRTFAKAFPNSYLIRTLPDAVGEFAPASDYLLIGINGTGHLDRETAEANLHASQGSTNVTLRGVDVLYKLIESDNLKGLFGEGPIHTDDVPALEFAAPKLIYADHGAEIRDHIRKGPNLSVTILETMSHSGDAVNAQLDFAAYAMSVFRPFPGMVDLTKADRVQRAHYDSLVTDYCTINSISDFSVFAPLSIKRTCVAGQVKALQQRLATGINRGPVLLAMASLLENAGEPMKALPLYQMALAEGGDDPSLNEAARMRIEALKISGNIF